MWGFSIQKLSRVFGSILLSLNAVSARLQFFSLLHPQTFEPVVQAESAVL
jgi:hypothetical protein